MSKIVLYKTTLNLEILHCFLKQPLVSAVALISVLMASQRVIQVLVFYYSVEITVVAVGEKFGFQNALTTVEYFSIHECACDGVGR